MSDFGFLRWMEQNKRRVAVAGVFGLVAWAGYHTLVKERVDALDAVERKVDGRKEEFLEKKRLAIALSAYRQQRVEVERQFGDALKLPGFTDMAYDAVMRAAMGRGLRIDGLRVDATSLVDGVAVYESPAEFKVTGPYHDLGKFLEDVASLPQFVVVEALRVEGTRESGLVSMEVNARVVRYVREQELQAAALQKKKKGSKK